jgi:hypothetical protein
MKRTWILAVVVCLLLSTAAALYFFRSFALRSASASPPAPPMSDSDEDDTPEPSELAQFAEHGSSPALSAFVPAGPVLVVEATDFGSLLRDWNHSDEKSAGLESDAYQVFSRSRVLLGLEKRLNEFADAAGVPADENFLSEAAGQRSVLALYDIGKLELLYITELPAARIMQNTLWQTRGAFDSRSIGAQPFFVHKDTESGRVIAFAASDRYLIVGTREDLVAGALELAAGQTSRSVQQEDWFHNTHAAAAEPGDLRMTLNMEKIVVAPLFRSYWIQQNITEMQGYSAAISDFYRSGATYREQRVLLPKSGARLPDDAPADAVTAQGERAVADLVADLPPDYGVYRAVANPKPEYCLAIVQSKLLSPRVEEPADQKEAPTITLTSGEAGSSSDLETRIDIAPAADSSAGHAFDALARLFTQANPTAMLWLHSTRENKQGPLLNVSTGVVLEAGAAWDGPSVLAALQNALRPGLTAATLGAEWRAGGPPANQYFALDGLVPFLVAVHGPQLVLANDEPTMLALLQSHSTTRPAPGKEKITPAIYAAGFRHDREREHFAELTRVLQRSALASKTSSDTFKDEPDFFSQTVASLSGTLEHVSSEAVVVRRSQDRVTETVVYRWTQ